MTRSRLYIFIGAACLVGYLFVGYEVMSHSMDGGGVCLFKKFTGYPCPSCGSTRSVMNLLHGDFFAAWMLNPFGYLIALGLLITPVWLIFDLIFRRNSLEKFYHATELFFSRKLVAIVAVALVLINWIWNIYKGI